MFAKGYPQDRNITYSGMVWLLAAQLLVMLPLAFQLPIWLIPVLAFTAAWRFRVMKGHMEQPGNLIKGVIGLLGIAALAASGLKHVSLDMMASLLVLGFAYKTLEVFHRRDAMVIIFTGYLLVGVQFLYSQSMLAALYGIVSITALTGALIAIQSSRSTSILPNLKLASLMLALCAPLMVAFFVFAPRISPLWTLNLSSGHAKTGMTDRMTPGDIASLSQSDDLAFRVTFQGERPAQNELYWRGLVLQHFDGKTWTQFADDPSAEEIKTRLRASEHEVKRKLVKEGFGKQYEVIYERSAQSWLFALAPVVDIKGEAIFGSDFRIMARQDVIEPLMLKLTSYPDAPKELDLAASTRRSALQLPTNQNPQTHVLVERLLGSSRSTEDYIQKVLNQYQQQAFYYTLRPPALRDSDSIDEFLFDSKRGFCAHYAGSFVYMMRAAGIPARVVAGYQGGEWNDKSNYLAVHQFDAHAWTEVWLEGEGWVRYDPTTMVAPNRVEQSLEVAMQEEGSFLEDQILSPVKHPWLDGLRKQLDASQYAWRRFVLGYDKDSQSQLMQRLFGEMSLSKMAFIIGVIFVAILGLWAIFLGLGKKQQAEAIEHQLYRKFCKLLAKKGVVRLPSQSPAEYCQLAAMQIPRFSQEIRDFTNLYTSICYHPGIENQQQKSINALKKLLKRIK